jgi:hypothetical protein
MGSRDIASPLLALALDEGEWSASRPCRITPEERVHGSHWIEERVDPRGSLNAVEKRKISYSGQESNSHSLFVSSVYRGLFPGE